MLLLLLVVNLLQVWPWCAKLEKVLPHVTTACESLLNESTEFFCVDRCRLRSVSSSARPARAGAALFVVGDVRNMALFYSFFLW